MRVANGNAQRRSVWAAECETEKPAEDFSVDLFHAAKPICLAIIHRRQDNRNPSFAARRMGIFVDQKAPEALNPLSIRRSPRLRMSGERFGRVPDVRQKILLCAPDFFTVDYVINPWMEHNRGNTDHGLARRQWTALRDALAPHADLVYVAPQPGLPDMVFTANAGLVLGDRAVVSRFRSPERRGEEPFFQAWFRENGFVPAPWPKNVFFEGAGDALFDRSLPILWCGFGIRSDEGAAGLLDKLLAPREVIALRLVDPRFYHLDTCFCPLAGGYLMYYPAAFHADSRAAIENAVPAEKRIAVGEEDALAFACNAVDLERHVFLNAAGPDLQNKLTAAGFTPVVTPLSEFLKAGGAAKCLTLKLRES
ncbi:MAG: dimethylarginine dimethylaminohydrolase family protein [Bdellovibrionales bacterium]